MTNQDFWTSIEEIISGDFSSEGLRTLERYADLFITGKLVYKRFSPFEQLGCQNGGITHVIASILAGAEIAANKLSAPVGSFKREQQRAEMQAKTIENWAKAVGCWIDDINKTIPLSLGDQIAEGGEAHVFDNGNNVIKAIGLDYFILPELALDRITLHNAYFPETHMQVLGFGNSSDGAFQIIVEQPFIQGGRMTDEEIRLFALNMGFELKNARNWTYATPEIYLSDLHDENVIKSIAGNIFVIDCDIRINTPELKAGGSRTLSNEVEFYL